jgi:cytochrome c-type biogenesis protein
MAAELSPRIVGLATFAFSAGAATFFAPCSYPLLPGYVAYFVGADDADADTVRSRLWRAVAVSGYVLLGFAVVYAALAGIVATLGTRVLADVVLVEPVVGLVLVVLGTAMALGINRPVGHVRLPERRHSRRGFVLFGVVYAVAAAGCTAPLLLGVAGASLQGGPGTAVLGLGSYAAGMATLMVAVTVLSAVGRDAVLRRLSAKTGHVTRLAGVLLVLAGGAQLYLFLFRFRGLARLGLG